MIFNKLSQYGSSFQIKVISSLLTNKKLLINLKDSINLDDFDDEAHRFIVETILKYFDKYHTVPSMEILSIEIKKIKNEILKIAVTEQLREAYRASEEDLEYISEEFSSFCTTQQVKQALLTSSDLLNLGDIEGIKTIMGNALKSGEDKNVGHMYEKDIETRYRDSDRHPIPFPWKAFNNITQGGYGRGELIILFGNPKGGKSWVAVAMAAYAASLGYNIAYYTLELSDVYVGRRFDSIFTDIVIEELNNNREKIEEKVSNLKGKIRIKEFSAKRASLDAIESHLNQLEQHEGFKPDAIFIDYLDLLKNRLSTRKEIRDDLDDIYTDARGLARERQVPLISPSQVNRAGAQDSIIEADKIAGSYGKIMIGDFVVSLSRKKKDKLNGTGRFHIMGSRIGDDGLSFNAKIDTSVGKIIIDEKPVINDEDEENDKGFKNNVDDDDKDFLRKKFFKTD